MNKTVTSTLQAITGVLAACFVLNLIVHIPFYILDGNMLKLFSPTWLVVDGITLFFCALFLVLSNRKKIARP